MQNSSWGIHCDIALRWMSYDLTYEKSVLAQAITRCHQATSYYTSQCWPRSVSSLGHNDLKSSFLQSQNGTHTSCIFFIISSVVFQSMATTIVCWKWTAPPPSVSCVQSGASLANYMESKCSSLKTQSCQGVNYRQVFDIRRTKSQHLKDSRTVLRLFLPSPLKPDVKSRMKM